MNYEFGDYPINIRFVGRRKEERVLIVILVIINLERLFGGLFLKCMLEVDFSHNRAENPARLTTPIGMRKVEGSGSGFWGKRRI